MVLEDKVELLVRLENIIIEFSRLLANPTHLVHLVPLQQTEVGSPQQVVLVVHDDLVRGGVQESGFSEQFTLLVLVFLFVGLLHNITLVRKVRNRLQGFKQGGCG